MTAYKTVLYAAADGVATVTLNRPDRLNAWTSQMHNEVKHAMLTAGADPAVKAIMLTGAGRGFCAGADMNNLTALSGGGTLADEGKLPDLPFPEDGSSRPDFRLRYGYFPSIPKPIVAAINGPCAGLGLVMSLYCDMRFAGRGAVFTTAFAARGLIAEHGISWLLPKLVGPSNAADLLFTARRFGAEEAQKLGMVNRVFDDADLVARTLAYLKTMASTVSPRSLAVMKRQLWEVQFQTLAEATVIANHEMDKSFASEDFKEGVAHYLEKRAPKFTGR